MTTKKTEAAREACRAACRAIDALDACEKTTPFAAWYKGAHAKARRAARQAVIAVESYATSEEEREMCRLFLSNLRNKATRSAELRLALEEPECNGHPAGPFDPMGQTVYCDGTCRA